jgi:hypothetical protein
MHAFIGGELFTALELAPGRFSEFKADEPDVSTVSGIITVPSVGSTISSLEAAIFRNLRRNNTLAKSC